MAKKQIELSSLQPVANSVIATDIPDYLVDSYYKYISYITAGRVCCNYLDGFLNIYRRTLYAAYKICRTHYVKAATLNSHVSGHYSPHGESPTATISLVSNGFLNIIGSNENNMGVEYADAAAPRYIEVKLHPIAEIVFLNNDLLPYVDYSLTELSTTENEIYEPTFLPVLLPGMYTAIADSSEFESYMEKGIKVIYPRYSIISLMNYVINYLKTGEFNKNILYYQYHNMVKKCSCDDQIRFEEEFKCPMSTDSENQVHILAKPPFANMENMLKNIPYVDLTSTHTDIVFPYKYINSSFKTTPKFNMLAYKVIDNNYEKAVLKPYTIRHAIYTIIYTLQNVLFPRYFKDKIQKTQDQIDEYNLLKVVHNKYVIQHIPYDQMTEEEQKCAGRHRVTNFMNVDKKINDLTIEKNTYIQRSQNIGQEILKLYETSLVKIIKLLQDYYKEENVILYDVTNI